MILVAGSANLDSVVRAAHIPGPGETVLGRDYQNFPGGKGANQAVACARSGAVPTQLLAALGNDAMAATLEAALKEAHVVLRDVRIHDKATGTAFICVSDSGENAITVAPGANAHLLPRHLVPLQGFSHLMMQLETPLETVVAYAQAAKAAGLSVMLNAAPAQSLPSALLENLDLLVVNEGELEAIAKASEGAQTDTTIAQRLARIHVPTVVVTLGERGSCARHHGEFFFHNAFAIEPVDTTAAGDAFCGALVAALSKSYSLPQALRQATAAATITCLRMGAQSSIPEYETIQSWLLEHEPVDHPLSSPQATVALRHYCGLSD